MTLLIFALIYICVVKCGKNKKSGKIQKSTVFGNKTVVDNKLYLFILIFCCFLKATERPPVNFSKRIDLLDFNLYKRKY